MTTLAATIYFLVLLSVCINLLMSGQRPTKTLAWLLFVIFLPVFGILMYLTFGLNRRHYKFSYVRSSQSARKHLEQTDAFFADLQDDDDSCVTSSEQSQYFERANVRSSGFRVTNGNSVTVLTNGHDTYERIFETLEKAQKYIHVQYYIFEDGELAERFADVFERKTKAGVEVRLLYDGLGSMTLDKGYLKRLREMGVETQSYFPIYLHKVFNWQINYRNHRKIVVVDGEFGFTGGINVSDKYITDDSELGKWYDHHVMIEGPAVWSLNTVFTLDWIFATDRDEILDKKYFPDIPNAGETKVQIIASGPDSDFPAIQYQYLAMIHSARDYIYIMNPYVIPDITILAALKISAMGGVDVRILLPEKSDSKVVAWSMNSYLEELLICGVKITRFNAGFLHSKVLISDDKYASIGTANMDIRSFQQNNEVNALLFDELTAKSLKGQFLQMSTSGKLVDQSEFENLPFAKRLVLKTCRVLSPLL